ncbi:MAG: putative potassium transport system protein kup [Candidatus Xenobia bacterium]
MTDPDNSEIMPVVPSTLSSTEVDQTRTIVAEEAHGRLWLLALGALGVVYGDIGTSPLYSLRESFLPHHGLAVSPDNVLGVLSLICWSLITVICIKYLVFVVRADHHGEGGILALAALVGRSRARHWKAYPWLALLGLFGTALLYGDGMITPSISVLSAVEGLSVATPLFDAYVIPITLAILIGLFLVQSHGTGRVAGVFGPITLLWFLTLTLLGLYQIVRAPAVLKCLSPHYALSFFLDNGWSAFLALGSVFLVVTGGEALYADMGHFGRSPIRWAWFTLVFPALLINYLGQGALLMRDPSAADHPFYRMVPPELLYPVVGLATAATVIASQALITGAFSLTLQAIQLGYLPRMQVEHTSVSEKGQIYVPFINWALMLACIGLVLGFRSSSNLAAAYGLAVTATMLITTMLFYSLLRSAWGWSRPRAGLLCGIFFAAELAFFAANVLKIAHGGWFPIVVGALTYLLMATWKQGKAAVTKALVDRSLPLERLLAQCDTRPYTRVGGLAVYMYSQRHGSPPALASNLHHNQVLHETNLFVSVVVMDQPWVPSEQRSRVLGLGHGFYRVLLRFGYMDAPDVPAALSQTRIDGELLNVEQASYFLGRETLRPRQTLRSGMPLWRERLFETMNRNAQDATSFFRIPPDQVVELGTQVEI